MNISKKENTSGHDCQNCRNQQYSSKNCNRKKFPNYKLPTMSGLSGDILDKAKLKAAIDAVIPQAKDFDDFLRLMAAQGYEIKQGKFISFRAPGQERFTRCKTLGENYTEEAITSRIKGLAVDRGPNRQHKGITLRIDLENNIKAQQSAGYARWAKLQNLKQAAKTMNFLTEHGIEQYAELESKVIEISAANDEAAAALKDVERRLGNMAVLIKNLTTYKQLRPVVLEYRKAKDKAAFRREHESQLILYEAAAKAIRDAGVTKLPNLAALKAEYRKLDEEKERLYQKYAPCFIGPSSFQILPVFMSWATSAA